MLIEISQRLARRLIGATLWLVALTLCGASAASEGRGSSVRLVCGHITVYVSATCPHCAAARVFLTRLVLTDERLRIDYREITTDTAALDDFVALNERHGISRPGVPTFDFCGEVVVGFNENVVLEALFGTREKASERGVEVPLFGYLNPDSIGLPAFTIALGLVDGFNPCAMWVLLFLLSILVNVKRRSRILMVAGTFVFISGLTYFAFMAAWLNIFLVVGYSRVLQLTLGVFAVIVGTVHVKDFFALHRGVSLSIPEAVKPKLYERVRRIVHADNVPAALAGTVTLAILVNFIELLCTAGLPALYTQILSYYALSDAAYYGYLALYNLAYIADDSVMVVIAIVTLGHRRLQEREGRWLKLLSGAFIVMLGLMLIVTPEVFAY